MVYATAPTTITRRRRARLVLGWCLVLSLVWAAFKVAFIVVPLPTRLATLDSPVMMYDNHEIAHIALAQDERWRYRVGLDEIDPNYLSALLEIEDSRYYEHGGVDLLAVVRAALQNLLAQRVVSGASTITMQLVRLLEPRPRSLRSKVIEAFRAYQLESRFTKKEILEEYLRFIPFGRNYEGIGVGTQALFGQNPKTLTTGQIATLIAIPQAPGNRYPSPRNMNNLRLGKRRIMKRLSPASDTTINLRVNNHRKVPTGYKSLPRQARHVAQHLIKTTARLRHTTTLNRGLQTRLRIRLNNLQEHYRRQGIRHASVLIADHTNAEIKAAMGSFDFEHTDGGQVIGFAARRSVGSTLKPYIYALALDRGLALPKMLTPDIPRQFGGYTPKNYDGQYRGLVPLDKALKASYNLPFIHLLEVLTPNALARLLSSTRFEGYHTHNAVDLTAAVGGSALRPIDLLGLYMALAQGGLYQSPTFKRRAVLTPPLQLISPGAALLTQRALTAQQRPEFTLSAQLKTVKGAIHWKTGTSFGHHDAWAIGSTNAIQLWCGSETSITNQAYLWLAENQPAHSSSIFSMSSVPASIHPQKTLRPVIHSRQSQRAPRQATRPTRAAQTAHPKRFLWVPQSAQLTPI